ncbi:hypothetical protein BGZ63DRAFT_203166 [Mariannaea sp. PMI_226]|nr:hypothetical protein BGZ63DRAFT_203166 [Mariannaea sp. PMI_226]
MSRDNKYDPNDWVGDISLSSLGSFGFLGGVQISLESFGGTCTWLDLCYPFLLFTFFSWDGGCLFCLPSTSFILFFSSSVKGHGAFSCQDKGRNSLGKLFFFIISLFLSFSFSFIVNASMRHP